MLKKIGFGAFFILTIGVGIASYDIVSVLIKSIFLDTTEIEQQDMTATSGPCNGRPCNVILIVSDTLSAQNMSVYGYERETTPFLTDFAKDKALVFDNSMSSASWTPPSMMALFFGRPPHQVLFSEVTDVKKSLITELKNEGVHVVGFLKMLPPPGEKTIISKVVNNHFTLTEAEYSISNYNTDHGKGFIDAAQWIKNRQSAQPYFMFIHDTTVHDPYDPPLKYREYFGKITDSVDFSSPTSTKKYYGKEAETVKVAYDQEVRYLDDQLKDFFASVGDMKDTVVIITSDHGEAFGEIDDRFLHGRPMEAIPSYSHNQVVRVPLLISGTNISSGRSDCPVSTLDLAPTIFSLMGLSKPDSFIGKPLLSGACQNEIVYSDQTKFSGADTVPIMNLDSAAPESLSKNFFTHATTTIISAQDKRFKVIEDGNGFFRVYDLESDTNETRDLSGSLSTLSSDEQAAIEKIRAFINEKYNE
jgi:arylsulfatase A-like enzyme